jgi:CubicO group peptidase (beta-lactamase class C family)
VRPDAQALRAAARPAVARLMREHGLVGVSLALADASGLLWAEGLGAADREAGHLARADTVYRAGSIAKPLTATAVVTLSRQGALALDRPLTAQLPGFAIRTRFPGGLAGITPRAVLAHRSGLPADLARGMYSEEPFTRVTAALAEEYAAFPPGLLYSYSNVGYSLLGHALQVASGRPFAVHLRETLLAPLALGHTELDGAPRAGPGVARGYRRGSPVADLPVRDVPALGLYTTARDLARFGQALLADGRLEGRQVLPAGLAAELFSPQPVEIPLDPHTWLGLGWFLEEDTVPGSGRVARHGGTTLVSAGELIVLPERGLAVAVLSNSAEGRAGVAAIAQSVLAAALYPTTPPAPTGAGRTDERPPAPEPTAAAGSFATSLGLITLLPGGHELCACLLGEALPVVAFADGWFAVDPQAAHRLPTELAGLGRARLAVRRINDLELLVARDGGRETVLGGQAVTGELPPAWRRRLGEYRVLDPDPGFPIEGPSLAEQHGVLCMSYRMPRLTASTIRVPLRPIADDEAVIQGLGRHRGETVRFVRTDAGERLRFSGYLAEPVAEASPGR